MARRTAPLDPYVVLGVHQGSTAVEIKRAYRERVLRCHPDRDPSPNAAEAFRRVHEAYRILSDPAERFLFEQRTRTADKRAPVRHNTSAPRGPLNGPRKAQEEPDRAIDPWLFKGLHVTGFLFGLGCVGGISMGYLFNDWPPFMLVFMLPGLVVLPDCWTVLFPKAKAPTDRGFRDR